ncbi:hypothetical protein [Phenylobacterium sp.]|jgi:ketosteroid isomerase-like protein|uniref:DUF6841 family protein n=1 Tax=Phenylobacterium sp. TaxID=1871053 RepID=UPI002F41012C
MNKSTEHNVAKNDYSSAFNGGAVGIESIDMSAEKEVAKLFYDYAEAYRRGDVDACQKCFAIPCTFIGSQLTIHMESHDAFVKHWDESHKVMSKVGVVGSSVEAVKVFMLDTNVALAAVMYERLDADGQVFNRGSGTYSVFKGDDGWKVIAYIMHGPETWLGELVRPSKIPDGR